MARLTVPLSVRLVAALTATFAALGEASAQTPTTDQCVDAFEEGQTLRKRLQLGEARARFASCARDACPAMVHADCAAQLEQVERDLPSIVVGAKSEGGHDIADVKITVDGRVLPADSGGSIPIDPGSHVLRFEHAAHEPHEERIVMRVGERNRTVVVTLRARGAAATRPAVLPREAPDSARSDRTVAYAVGGTGLVVFAVGAGFGAAVAVQCGGLFRRPCDAIHEASDSEKADTKSALDRQAWISNVALVLGLAGVGTGAFLLYRASRTSTSTSTGTVSVAPRSFAHGGGLALDGTF